MIIDTHAHLADAEFDNDLPEVLERAIAEKSGGWIDDVVSILAVE